jgi:hypothetical protein
VLIGEAFRYLLPTYAVTMDGPLAVLFALPFVGIASIAAIALAVVTVIALAFLFVDRLRVFRTPASERLAVAAEQHDRAEAFLTELESGPGSSPRTHSD